MTATEVQRAVKAILAADETLRTAGIEAVAMDDGHLKAAIEKAHALGGRGIVAVVSAPTFKPKSNAAKNAVGDIRIRVATSETPAINRKRAGHMTGPDAAWHIAYLLNLAKIEDGPMLALDGEIASVTDRDGATVVTSASFVGTHQLKG